MRVLTRPGAQGHVARGSATRSPHSGTSEPPPAAQRGPGLVLGLSWALEPGNGQCGGASSCATARDPTFSGPQNRSPEARNPF